MPVTRRLSFRAHGIFVWVLAVFTLSEWVSSRLGIRFATNTLDTLYQYLDPALLKQDLLRSVVALHAQPPLFNIFLGFGLQVFPDAWASFFEWSYGLMGLGLLAGMVVLMRRLEIPTWIIAGTTLVFGLSPNFMVYRDWLFYTLPVACLLVAMALCWKGTGLSHARSRRVFAGLATVLMMTRAVFHPLWWAAAAAIALVTHRTIPARRFGWMVTVPLAITLLLFAKNFALVGNFGSSSWLGMNLAKRWPLSQQEVQRLKADRVMPSYWHRRPFMEPDAFIGYGFFDGRSNGPLAHPALDAPYKSNGEPNFNHRDYPRIASEMLRGDLNLVVRYPKRYLRRVLTATLLYLQPGPNSVHFLVDYDFQRVHSLRRGLNRALLGGEIQRPIRMLEPPLNLFVPLFVLLLVFATYRTRSETPEIRRLYSFMLWTVVWVSVVTNLIEIGENDRMRWEIEPFLVIFLADLLAQGQRWIAGLRPGEKIGAVISD